jgi:hypothetical protein
MENVSNGRTGLICSLLSIIYFLFINISFKNNYPSGHINSNQSNKFHFNIRESTDIPGFNIEFLLIGLKMA